MHQPFQTDKEGTYVAKTKSVSSFEDIPVEALVKIDLRNSADMIETTFPDKLLPPPKGIYRVGLVNPVMIDGVSYYYHVPGETAPKLVEDINKVEDSAVYDASGKCVIPLTYMRQKARFLANVPMLPYRGLHVMRAVVDNQINSFAAYHRHGIKSFADQLGAHFLPSVEINEELINMVENCCRQVRTEITLFLGSNEWSMFFTKLQGTTLLVEKSMDWRAWEWEQKHGESFRHGRYS